MRLLTCYQALLYLFFLSSITIHSGESSEQLSPMMQAAKEGNIGKIQQLLNNKASINEKSSTGKTPLHYALYQKNQEAALCLLKNGADAKALDSQENTPLSLARLHSMPEVIGLLNSLLTEYKKRKGSNNQHFTLLIASYNNAAWYAKNVSSVLNQKYSYYTAIYIDDCSTDGTLALVKKLVKEHNQESKWIFIENKTKKYCLGNYLYAIERFCPDNTIIITLDGDDWLLGPYVLTYLNKLYQDPTILLTYGESIVYPTREKTNHCKPINPTLFKKPGLFRSLCKKRIYWPVHHLRSFFTALFRKIKHTDLLDNNGQPFTYAEDVAYMLPMLEMVGPDHYLYNSKKLYVYNRKNSIITTKKVGYTAIHQKLKLICSRQPYLPLNSLEINSLREQRSKV